MSSISRRAFAQRTLGGTAALGLAELGLVRGLGPVSAADAELRPDVVRLDPEIEPLVRLVEETPRDRLLEEVAGRVRGGTSYREVLAALLLAGVRNVQPRPRVGFKFHAVLVVNSAHLASLASPDADRWLPIFWALDHFKDAQAKDVSEGDWTMRPVDEARVPAASKARRALIEAFEAWDVEAADAAIAGLARSAPAGEIYELMYQYGARDFRSIGHKAIYVANSRRTLSCIGWQHAEPILRSLVYAILNAEGDDPRQGDNLADRPGKLNQELAEKLPENWRDGKRDEQAAWGFVEVLRQANYEDACRQAVANVSGGLAAESIWDAVFATSGELLMRSPGIVALHAVTSANALHYAWTACADDRTRRLALLQAVAFVTMFRDAVHQRGGKVSEQRLDQLEPLATSDDAVAEIFNSVSSDRMTATRQALAYLTEHPDPQPLAAAARQLVFLKGNDAHDYKYSSAVLEDYRHLAPGFRERFLATSMFNLPGAGDKDNPLVERTRAALAS